MPLLRKTSGNLGRQVVDLSTEPSPAIMAGGIDGHSHSQHYIERGGVEDIPNANGKPPYRVPLMTEVAAMPWNGLTVASTFAGAGGSSTGYRMAGYRVLWANEFVPAAQESYRANMRAGTVLDCRDVRDVQPEEILKACGLAKGELDVLDGSPPCQAFSTAGKRNKGWGQEKTYEHGAKQRNEDLFFEYVRILRGLMPRAFVAENVAGLVKGVAKGYFIEILAALKSCGYRVGARVLDAQWLGVPQTRSRVIFVGVREDFSLAPAFPSPLPYRYSVREAIPWLVSCRSGPTGFGVGSQTADLPAPAVSASMQAPYGAHEVEIVCDQTTSGFRGSGPALKRQCLDAPMPAVMAEGMGGHTPGDWTVRPVGTEKRKFTIAELRRICSFPDDFVLTGSYAQQWERLGNSVPPLMMRAVAGSLKDGVLLPARARTAAPAGRLSARSTSATPRTGAAPRPPARATRTRATKTETRPRRRARAAPPGGPPSA